MIAAMKAAVRTAVMLGAASMAPSAAGAQDAAPQGGGFTVDATVYAWLAGTSGEITPRPGAPTLEFDNDFGEVLSDLDFAAFGSVHAHNGSLALLGDISYASLSREGRVPPGIPAEGAFKQFSLTAAAGPRLLDTGTAALDVFAGVRLWDVDASVAVPLAGLSASPGKTFVDPILAARVVTQVAPRLSLMAYGDLGGLGVGSEFTYQLAATLNYRLGDSVFLSAGYRHLALDYDDDGTALDASMTGPMIGLTKRF